MKKTLLLLAGRCSRTEIVKHLLAARANIKTEFGSFNTLLTRLVLARKFGLTQFLINKGARLEVRNNRKETLLYIVVIEYNTEGVDFLLKNYSDTGV